MCCATGSHYGFERRGHQNVCFCGCDEPWNFSSQFMTKKQKIAKLEEHLEDLRDETKAIEAQIAKIKNEK